MGFRLRASGLDQCIMGNRPDTSEHPGARLCLALVVAVVHLDAHRHQDSHGRAWVTDSTELPDLDLIWGAAAIGQAINRSPRQVFHLLENGQIPPASKLGGQWVVSRRLLRQIFEPGSKSP